ncbi:hypothetical protein Cgig2_026997 [Carnegiea gigantea]|uniref:Uncharacterized protein n=1 Tax=Carnegiea gigantea TaxID=171969 RepID=A0A9Q1Q8D4_9CARY|nr:hypothetical protein Cgig2_026997 [Carnegiea gigantea]
MEEVVNVLEVMQEKEYEDIPLVRADVKPYLVEIDIVNQYDESMGNDNKEDEEEEEEENEEFSNSELSISLLDNDMQEVQWEDTSDSNETKTSDNNDSLEPLMGHKCGLSRVLNATYERLKKPNIKPTIVIPKAITPIIDPNAASFIVKCISRVIVLVANLEVCSSDTYL